MDAELIAEARLADSGLVIRQSLQPGLVSSSPAGRSPTPLLVLGRLIGSQSVYCIVDSTACDTFLGKVLYNVGCFLCGINFLTLSRKASRSATVNIIFKLIVAILIQHK